MATTFKVTQCSAKDTLKERKVCSKTITGDFVCFLLHTAWVQVAARCRYSDQTGGEGQEQSVAAPVQRQGQELTGLRRILTTPGAMHKGQARRQRARSQQREVNGMFLASHQSWRGSKASSVGAVKTFLCPTPHKNGHKKSRVFCRPVQMMHRAGAVRSINPLFFSWNGSSTSNVHMFCSSLLDSH